MSGFNLYLDESYENTAPFIALSGVIVAHDKWKPLHDQLSTLKMKYFGDKDFNLKAIRRNKYDKQGKWISLSDSQKKSFESEYFTILQDKATLMVSLIDQSKMNGKDKNKLFELAYSFLLQRFEYHLDSFPGAYGSVIIDSAKTSTEIKNLWNVHRDILEKGVITKGYSTVDNLDGTISILFNTPTRRQINKIFENLIFQPDDTNDCLQIADLVASAFAVEYNRKKGMFSSPYKSLLRQKSDGTVQGYGIKIFPK